jgi:branched-chain amino acid transport system ATP-binding protein
MADSGRAAGPDAATGAGPRAEADAVLDVRDLTVHYGHVVAVDGLSLHVGIGEAVALLGANGAGKTSTLHAISGLVTSTGSVSFQGQAINRRRPEAIARVGLVHVPEGRRVFPNLNVHENLQVGRTAKSGRTDGFSLDDVYDLFPALGPLRRRGGWALSGGEQQMVAIGRALVGAPQLLLLDEPSLGLAPAVVRSVFEALTEVVSRVPILLVEQNTSLALELCHRAYVLAKGSVALEGTAAELDDRQAMLDSYLGRS